MITDKWIYTLLPIVIAIQTFIIYKIFNVTQNKDNKNKLDYIKYIELVLLIVFTSGTSYSLLKHTNMSRHYDKLVVLFIVACVVGFWIFTYKHIITGDIKELVEQPKIIKPTTRASPKLDYLFKEQIFSMIPSIFRFKKPIYQYNYNFKQDYPVNKLSPEIKEPDHVFVNTVSNYEKDLVNIKEYEIDFMKSK